MNLAESLIFLMRDGNLDVPCSRYGRDTRECAMTAIAVAQYIAEETGEQVTTDSLDSIMGLVVNDHEDVAEMIERMEVDAKARSWAQSWNNTFADGQEIR